MARSGSTLPVAISISRLVCCAGDSTDRGSCRIRLPPSVWSAAGLPYHKPVIVSIPSAGSDRPWKLLCVAALADEDGAGVALQAQHTQHAQCSTLDSKARATPRPVPTAVVDPTVVVVPPGKELHQLRGLLRGPAVTEPGCAAGSGPQAEVSPCRGSGVSAATEITLRVPPGQEHLASPRMSFKLHQALVLPGCCLRLSDACAVHIVAVKPRPGPDQPLRIVPSTRILLEGQQGQGQGQGQREGQAHGPQEASGAEHLEGPSPLSEGAPLAAAGSRSLGSLGSSGRAAKGTGAAVATADVDSADEVASVSSVGRRKSGRPGDPSGGDPAALATTLAAFRSGRGTEPGQESASGAGAGGAAGCKGSGKAGRKQGAAGIGNADARREAERSALEPDSVDGADGGRLGSAAGGDGAASVATVTSEGAEGSAASSAKVKGKTASAQSNRVKAAQGRVEGGIAPEGGGGEGKGGAREGTAGNKGGAREGTAGNKGGAREGTAGNSALEAKPKAKAKAKSKSGGKATPRGGGIAASGSLFDALLGLGGDDD